MQPPKTFSAVFSKEIEPNNLKSIAVVAEELKIHPAALPL